MEKPKYCAGCGKKLNKDGVCECGHNCKCGSDCSCDGHCENKKAEKYNKTGITVVVCFCIFAFFGLVLIGSTTYAIGKLVYNIISDDEFVKEFEDETLDFPYTKKTYKTNEKFKYDNFEITISDKFEFFEDRNNTLIKIPIKVKNVDENSKTFDYYGYTVYDPKGVETKKTGFYYEDGLESIPSLQPNAEYESFIYAIYKTDGVYQIEFDDAEQLSKIDIKIIK